MNPKCGRAAVSGRRPRAGRLSRAALLCLLLLCLAGRAFGEEAADGSIDRLMAGLSLHEKVCQLFFVEPEQFSRLEKVTAPSGQLTRAFGRFPVGGVILSSGHITSRSLARLNSAMQQAAAEANGIGLLIGVDEEGGGVSRVANKPTLPENQPAAADIATPEQARRSAGIIGGYLSRYGFNVDFAPVADVRTPVKNPEIVRRAYSDDPATVGRMAAAFVTGAKESGVIPVLKHFPGHGPVSGNTHKGPGVSERTAEEWRRIDFLPFREGIRAGADMVLLSHQLAVHVDPELPASLSPTVVGFLRNELGFDGVVITDALRMSAIRERYGSGEACVRALEAGADMLLLPYNFTNAYRGVIQALESGRLTEARIDESVRRILTMKAAHGLIPATEVSD